MLYKLQNRPRHSFSLATGFHSSQFGWICPGEALEEVMPSLHPRSERPSSLLPNPYYKHVRNCEQIERKGREKLQRRNSYDADSLVGFWCFNWWLMKGSRTNTETSSLIHHHQEPNVSWQRLIEQGSKDGPYGKDCGEKRTSTMSLHCRRQIFHRRNHDFEPSD